MRNTVIRTLWAVILLLTSPALLYVKLLKRLKMIRTYDRAVTFMSKLLLKCLLFTAGGRVSISGLENLPEKGPVLFISNHQGHLDSPILHAYIPVQTAFISIVSARKIPVIGTWMSAMRCIFMDRADPRQMVRSINEGVELIKSGYNLFVFPEGKTANGDSIGEFKRGTFQLAFRSGVPIVPVSVRGSYKLMDYYGKLTGSARVTITVGKPIETAGCAKADEPALMDEVVSVIRDNLHLDQPMNT